MPPVIEEPKETLAPAEFKVSHTCHDHGMASINIEVEDRQVITRCHPWTHKPGYLADLTIFRLTADEIQQLGILLVNEALRIKETT